MANEQSFADHKRTIFHSAEEAEFSLRGYWLTKRRDGRSDNWMIARYQPSNRSIIYRSCGTRDLEQAKCQLGEFANDNPEGVAPPSSRRSEVVYFIQAETGQIKIGIARDVQMRLAALQTMSPVKLTLVAQGRGGQPAEAAYHRRFAAHRLHGEWFRRTPEIELEIARLQGGVA